MQVSEQPVSIPVEGGATLAGTLYLPVSGGPFATLLEALPYRMYDITSSYAESYHRFCTEGGFAVLRIDVRGTGNSTGVAEDEYPDVERRDLRTAIEWAAAQPWSTGKVGMFGTSYSGFNSLHMAAEGIPQLGGVAAMYATDDRYTDDVHYMGGVLRALDLIDYPLYMIAMNALPPTPAAFGDGWIDEWRRRIDQHEPWLLEWLRHPTPDDTWRRGSVRLGPDGDGYERAACPVLLIAGWADGYRNNTFRAIEQLPDWELIAGPWSHKDPAVARPGPNIDCDLELMRFFDRTLRDGAAVPASRGRVFVRRPTAPEPDLALHNGSWVEVDEWPPPGLRATVFANDAGDDDPDDGAVDEIVVAGDVGVAAWNSCAGGLPWGQSLDQRTDNARSITYDWSHTDETMVLGHAEVALQVRSSAAVGHVSVKLCDVAPDGTSTLITRTLVDLAQRGVWPCDPFGTLGAAPQPVVPGEWIDVRLQFEATTWTLVPGHRLRLAINGTDWPNCWPAAQPYSLAVRRDSVRLTVPTFATLPAARDVFEPGPGPSPTHDDAEGVEWRYGYDVLGREARVHSKYGGPYDGTHGTSVVDLYEGDLGVSTTDPSNSWARGRARFDMTFALADGATTECATEAQLDVRSDGDWFHVEIALTVTRDGAPFGERRWAERFAR